MDNKKNNNFSKMFSTTKFWLPILLSLAAITISINNCSEKNKIQEELELIENIRLLSEFQPKIKTIGKPICDSILYVLDTVEIKNVISNFDINNVKVEEKIVNNEKYLFVNGFQIPYEPVLYYQLKVINNGFSNAELIYINIIDDLEGNFIIKENLDSLRSLANDKQNRLAINRIIEIGDTTIFELHQPLLNYKDNKFQIQILIYYKNNLENLYETYIWIEGELKKTHTKIGFEKQKYLLPLQKKHPCSSVYFHNPRDILHYYFPDEKDSILSIIHNEFN